MEESLSLVKTLGLSESLSGATNYINAATTLSFFGSVQEGLELYDKAATCYQKNGRTQIYEYAALLNSKANNLGIKGIARTYRHHRKHIISSPLEHASVSGPLPYLQEQGYNELNRQKIESNAQLLHIPITVFETNIFNVADSTDNSPCYLCAKMRRGHLYNFGKLQR